MTTQDPVGGGRNECGGHRLRPETSFQTMALREAPVAQTVAALCAGMRCAVLGEKAVRAVRWWLVDAARAAESGVAATSTLAVDQGTREVRSCDVRSWLAGLDGALAGATAGAPGPQRPLALVDNRLATPFLCRPLQMGADAVLEDLGTLLGLGSGVVVAARTEAAWDRLCRCLELAGAGNDCTALEVDGRLGSLGLVSVPARMQQACDTALAVAHYLSKHPRVVRVSYPGLPGDPANDAARRALEHGFGNAVVFELTVPAQGEGRAPSADGMPDRGDSLPSGRGRGETDVPEAIATDLGTEPQVDPGAFSRAPATWVPPGAVPAASCTCLMEPGKPPSPLVSTIEPLRGHAYVLRACLESSLDVVGALEAFIASQ